MNSFRMTSVFVSLTSLLCAFSVSADESMIEVVQHEGLSTVVADQSGQEWRIEPARIEHDAQTGEVTSVEVIESSKELDWSFSFGINNTQAVQVTFGLIYGPVKTSTHTNPTEPAQFETFENHGYLFELSPGTDGGQASVGYIYRFKQSKVRKWIGNTTLKTTVAFGADAKLSLVRTWGVSGFPHYFDRGADQTYIGLQADLLFLGMKFSVGHLKHIAGNQPGTGWLTTMGMGMGW